MEKASIAALAPVTYLVMVRRVEGNKDNKDSTLEPAPMLYSLHISVQRRLVGCRAQLAGSARPYPRALILSLTVPRRHRKKRCLCWAARVLV